MRTRQQIRLGWREEERAEECGRTDDDDEAPFLRGSWSSRSLASLSPPGPPFEPAPAPTPTPTPKGELPCPRSDGASSILFVLTSPPALAAAK